MADQPTANLGDLVYEDTGANASLVYFDVKGARGIMSGSIEIELATHSWAEVGWPDRGQIFSGRLPCIQNAATNVRNGLDSVLKMLEQPQGGAAAIAARG